MSFSRLAARLLVPAAVVGVAVTSAAVPAYAVYVPPPAPATLATANPADVTPHVQNGSVRAFAQIGNTVYAGGSFSGVKLPGATTWTAVTNLFAYDATTGAIRAGFRPVLDNAVQTLAVSPDNKLIVGGNFGTVNGVARKNLVQLDPATGATVTSWVGRADGGTVRRAVVHGNHLYVAGAFHWVNGTEHSLLARLNATTGQIDASFRIDASGARPYPNSTELVWALAVAPDGRTVVATGNFTEVNGRPRNQVVLIDTSGTPAVADWSTNRYVSPCSSASFPFYARDVDFDDTGKYFVIAADGGRPTEGGYCDAVARFETADRGAVNDATWVDFTGGDSVTAIEAADGVVYAGGHFRWMNNTAGADSVGPGAVDRYGYAALDANNGVPLPWNPGRSSGGHLPTGGTAWGPIVWEIWKGPNGVHAGQDSDGVGNEYHGRHAFFPMTGGSTVAVQDAPSAASGFLYRGTGTATLHRAAFGPGGLGASGSVTKTNLTGAQATFTVNNKVYWSDAAGTLRVSPHSGGDPWKGNGFNDWFDASTMTGAFFLKGRMYFTTAGSNALQYRYLTTGGSIIGCTVFTLPTAGVDWTAVRGMAWVNGKLVHGHTDGRLRSVPFDPAAALAVNGAASTVVANSAGWNTKTLYFAAS